MVAVITRVLVDADDPAFGEPTKFIGPVYDQDRAQALAAERGWAVTPDGDRWRRVVVAEGAGQVGVEAVIDKDLASALPAIGLDADILVLATDVDAVNSDWGEPRQRAVAGTTPGWLRARSFAGASMGPKVEAVCRFVEATGRRAVIGRLEDLAGLIEGTAGTQIRADKPRPLAPQLVSSSRWSSA
jgi:carbamate kinase